MIDPLLDAPRDVLGEARDRLSSGCYLPPRSIAASERVLVVARHHHDADVAELAATVADLQLARMNFRPVFLVGQVDTSPLSRFGFQFETAMDEAMLTACVPGTSPDAYWRGRVNEMLAVYGPHRTIHVEAGSTVPSWMFP